MKDIKCMLIGQFEDSDYGEVWNPDKKDTIKFMSGQILPPGVNLTDSLLTTYLAASLMNLLLVKPQRMSNYTKLIMMGEPYIDREKQTSAWYCNNFFHVETMAPPGLIEAVATRKKAYQFTVRRLPPSALLPDASNPEGYYDAYNLLYPHLTVKSDHAERSGYALPVLDGDNITFTSHYCAVVESRLAGEPVDDDGIDEGELTPVDPKPPVINCTPTSFNITQIQGDTTKGGNVIAVASIWYEGQEYPYITVGTQMAYIVANVDANKLSFANGFSTGINLYDKVYNKFPEYGKAIVLPRNRSDNFFIAGAGHDNLDKYVVSTLMWDGSTGDKSFKSDTMRVIDSPSQIRLTKLSPEMKQFIKTHGGDLGTFLNGSYNVNNLVDMINKGEDIVVDACVKVESNLFPTSPVQPPVVTTPPTPAMAIVNMISDTPFISTFKNGFELESYYDAQAEGYRIENENNKVYLRDPAYAPVVSFRPKQGNLMGATQIQGEVYDWKGIGFDISLATPKHLNKIQNIYGLPSNDVVLVMLSQLNEEQSAPPILNGRFVCNPEFE